MSNARALKDRLARGGQADRIRESAFRALDRTQDDPAVQIRGLAIALAAIAIEHGLDMRELIVTSELMIKDIDSPYAPHMRAIREYAKHEIGRYK